MPATCMYSANISGENFTTIIPTIEKDMYFKSIHVAELLFNATDVCILYLCTCTIICQRLRV